MYLDAAIYKDSEQLFHSFEINSIDLCKMILKYVLYPIMIKDKSLNSVHPLSPIILDVMLNRFLDNKFLGPIRIVDHFDESIVLLIYINE